MSNSQSTPWQRVGVVLGPLLALTVYFALPDTGEHALDSAGRATAAIAVLMAAWWLTVALPLPATSLLPLALFPLLGIAQIGTAARPYASDVIFLFMGGFMLGLAMERWNLHKRLALNIIAFIGASPARLIAGFMIATAFLSMWISNTATTIILLPVAVSVIRLVLTSTDTGASQAQSRAFAVCLVLAVAYSASIGGTGTLIGSPPNAVVAAYISQQLGCEVGMLDWMRFGIPALVLMLPLTWAYLVYVAFPFGKLDLPGGAAHVREARIALGPMSRGEKSVCIVFVITALAWILRPQLAAWLDLPGLSDAGIAMLAALTMFLLPAGNGRAVLDWDTAVRLPWGVLILFGGGLSLAAAVTAHGVDTFIAGGFSSLSGLHPLLVLLAVATLIVFATELTSNTAVATAFTPVLAAISIGLGAPPIIMLLAIGLGANYAFMMPVGTPPNAIAFASGHVSIAQMARAGVYLNIVAIMVVTGVVWWAAPSFCN